MILIGIPGGDIGLANIYAPTEKADWCLMWESLANNLPQSCRWMLLGEFNVVEGWTDKLRQGATMIPHRERALFDAMKSALNIDDNFCSAGRLKYSWDYNRLKRERALAHLYR